ncbi:MAG: hypothetical protein KKA73_10050 [Chloroflexi bacterium]|nr:hypothetical protein [Chloroflexota bacterium]MBU1748019.1 hypothetical protein [Chloroflexota bacterium]
MTDEMGFYTPAAADDRRRFYRGNSMAGTFRLGDYLTIEPALLEAIRPGDVVIYQGGDQEGEPNDIVHRVVAQTPDGLVARGDNNPCVDTILVTEANLLGRVTYLERGGIIRPVRGGRWGLLRARTFHARRRARRMGARIVRLLGRWPYRALRRSGLLPRLWHPTITRIQFATDDGPVVKYVSGGRTVARWWLETDQFRCRRPYDLVIVRPQREASDTRCAE